MCEKTLQGCHVLIVEDEYLLASELSAALQEAGAIVIGPIGQLDAVLERIQAETDIHGALLDVNLGGVSVFPAADLLAARGVPMVFTTGYDASSIPDRYAEVPRCEKPVSLAKVTEAIGRMIHG